MMLKGTDHQLFDEAFCCVVEAELSKLSFQREEKDRK